MKEKDEDEEDESYKEKQVFSNIIGRGGEIRDQTVGGVRDGVLEDETDEG